MPEILYKDESYKIVGACFEVYKEKGCGFLEAVYQECLRMEFEIQSVSAIPKPSLSLQYKGRELEQKYQPDFLCHGKIVVELKALISLADEHKAQVMNYLKATGYKLGLLINFGHYPKLEYKRITAHDHWETSAELMEVSL